MIIGYCCPFLCGCGCGCGLLCSSFTLKVQMHISLTNCKCSSISLYVKIPLIIGDYSLSGRTFLDPWSSCCSYRTCWCRTIPTSTSTVRLGYCTDYGAIQTLSLQDIFLKSGSHCVHLILKISLQSSMYSRYFGGSCFSLILDFFLRFFFADTEN